MNSLDLKKIVAEIDFPEVKYRVNEPNTDELGWSFAINDTHFAFFAANEWVGQESLNVVKQRVKSVLNTVSEKLYEHGVSHDLNEKFVRVLR